MNPWLAPPIEVGHRVEVRRDGREGEPGVVVGFKDHRAIVRFPDHEEILVHPKMLTWLPSETEIRREHLAERRGEPLDAWAYWDEDGL